MKDLYRYEENLLFLLSKAHWKLSKLLSQAYSKAGETVTPDQWLILLNLANEGPMFQSALARQQHKDRAAIKRLIDQLENKGLVVRERNKTDLRLKTVLLTVNGKEAVHRINKLTKQSVKHAVKDLSEVEINALKRLVGRINP